MITLLSVTAHREIACTNQKDQKVVIVDCTQKQNVLNSTELDPELNTISGWRFIRLSNESLHSDRQVIHKDEDKLEEYTHEVL